MLDVLMVAALVLVSPLLLFLTGRVLPFVVTAAAFAVALFNVSNLARYGSSPEAWAWLAGGVLLAALGVVAILRAERRARAARIEAMRREQRPRLAAF